MTNLDPNLPFSEAGLVDNESTYSDPAVRQAIVDAANVPQAQDWFPTPSAEPARTWSGRELPEPSMSESVDPSECYPKGPTVAALHERRPQAIKAANGEVVATAPDVRNAVVHVWGAFAGLALELGGYQDVEVCDPYSGRRLWVPIPDDLGNNPFAWYQYALEVAAGYDWSREGDGGLLPIEPGTTHKPGGDMSSSVCHAGPLASCPSAFCARAVASGTLQAIDQLRREQR